MAYKRSNKFSKIDNNLIAYMDLSNTAFRVGCSMISKPPNWQFNVVAMQKELKMSSRTLARAFSELKEIGLLTTTKIKVSENKYTWIYKINP